MVEKLEKQAEYVFGDGTRRVYLGVVYDITGQKYLLFECVEGRREKLIIDRDEFYGAGWAGTVTRAPEGQ